jgi:hypothetical protein
MLTDKDGILVSYIKILPALKRKEIARNCQRGKLIVNFDLGSLVRIRIESLRSVNRVISHDISFSHALLLHLCPKYFELEINLALTAMPRWYTKNPLSLVKVSQGTQGPSHFYFL